MRNTLRGLAVVLSMCFCLSAFPARILSADSKGTCGDGVKWEVEGEKLTISYTGSGTGVMDSFNNEIEEKLDTAGGDEEYIYYYNYPWQAFRNSISEVVISEGVTTIGSHAFAMLKNLKSVTIPEGITLIGKEAFEQSGYGNPDGFDVVIPGTVTSICDYAFNGAYLRRVVIRNGVASIGEGAFMDCNLLTSIVIPASVVTIGNFAFYRCKGLVKVTGGAKLEKIGTSAFAFCPRLKTFVITSGVLNKIGAYAFNEDKKLTVISIKKTTRLSGTGVEKSLKGSFVKKVKVKANKVKRYKKVFKGSVTGRTVTVKK